MNNNAVLDYYTPNHHSWRYHLSASLLHPYFAMLQQSFHCLFQIDVRTTKMAASHVSIKNSCHNHIMIQVQYLSDHIVSKSHSKTKIPQSRVRNPRGTGGGARGAGPIGIRKPPSYVTGVVYAARASTPHYPSRAAESSRDRPPDAARLRLLT